MGRLFITFEGVEGSGKSTQIYLLKERLEADGHEVVATREPGGTWLGAQIRKIALDSSTGELSPITELLLFSAARSEIVSRVIKPALYQGKVVLCDRFADSTLAYQGSGRGVDERTIRNMIELVCGDLSPDLTILLDMPVTEGLKRSKERLAKESVNEGRFEQEERKFHERVRARFLEIARTFPERVKVIDANGTREEIGARIFEEAQKALKG